MHPPRETEAFSRKRATLERLLAEARRIFADLLSMDLDQLPPRQALTALLEYLFDQYGADPELRSLAQESFRLHEHGTHNQNRFGAIAAPLIELIERILKRGVESEDFLTTLWFTSRHITSTATGFDTNTPAGLKAWRSYAIDFVLSAVLATNRPSLSRPKVNAG